MPLVVSRRVFDSVRAAIICQAGLHYEASGHREYVHSETGVRTLKDEFDKVAWHNEHHLGQIELALASQRLPTALELDGGVHRVDFYAGG